MSSANRIERRPSDRLPRGKTTTKLPSSPLRVVNGRVIKAGTLSSGMGSVADAAWRSRATWPVVSARRNGSSRTARISASRSSLACSVAGSVGNRSCKLSTARMSESRAAKSLSASVTVRTSSDESRRM